MKTKFFILSSIFTLMSIVSLSAAKFYFYTGSDPWGSRSDGTKVEIREGNFHLTLNGLAAGDEAWIAHGTYTTSTSPATIALKQGVKIFGGFKGNETSIDKRLLADETGGNGVAEPWEFKFPTIIQGTGTAESPVSFAMFDSNTTYTLDGVTMETHYVLAQFGGAVNNRGGAATPVINSCTIRNIHKSWDKKSGGGGVAIYVAGPATISGCLIENNVLYANTDAATGWPSSNGGILTVAKSATIVGNVLRNNNSNGGAQTVRAGAINLLSGADTNVGLVANNVIYNNTFMASAIYMPAKGGGYNIVNNTIVNNFASGGNTAYVSGIAYIPDNVKIYNNIVFNNAVGNPNTFKSFCTAGGAVVDLQNNAYNGSTVIQRSKDPVVDGSYKSVNNNASLSRPEFVSPSKSIGYSATMTADVRAANFALKSSAKALIDKGGYFPGITHAVDIIGNPRPTESNKIDIGAYEFSK